MDPNSQLLPKDFAEFRDKRYWENFFTARDECGDGTFEWYGNFKQLSPILSDFVSAGDAVLCPGCGNSASSADLYDTGVEAITNIDFSEVVIEQMKTLHSLPRSNMKWLVMNMLDLQFKDGTFDVVFDKGALDALMGTDTDESRQEASQMFAEFSRVLGDNGRFICVSMAQGFVLHHLLEHFLNMESANPALPFYWKLDIQQVSRLEGSKSPLRPFVFTFIKVPSKGEIPDIPEVKVLKKSAFDDALTTKEGIAMIEQWILQRQEFEVSRTQFSALRVGSIFRFDVLGTKDDQRQPTSALEVMRQKNLRHTARFSLTVIDHSLRAKNGTCACFIVPQGREHEWLFTSDEGLKQLAESANFNRLVVASMNRKHSFKSMEAVQSELSPYILELVPNRTHIRRGASEDQIPFMSLDDGIGKRNIVHTGSSKFSGEFTVEDTDPMQDETKRSFVMRRLFFATNPFLVQSETKILTGAKGVTGKDLFSSGTLKKGEGSPDMTCIAFDYHQVSSLY
jgi:ubiquinone/menaquinone biosynthesis C-methylase UbiE